jgi:hypothetical protein
MEKICKKSQFGGKSANQCIGGTVPVPPLAMEMQIGNTNNYISQTFFVFAAPMY